ncbi:glutamine amidotransferase [Janthinobacterium sp. 17J80-10]|uniref:glutamine amidotransferase n=1 Tax=Janthinobacterium sp. 17J80-10 TaxID=2497863 RepID=UPI0010054EBF|nr:glutamine amidotransferase [Janthinobacterium sp. 17J80-10]QAU33888.1 glutamine amidotransferase [Janthinobacterium sp. 17J80-10]
MKPLVIFKVGETFSGLSRQIGDFEHWIMNGIGSAAIPVTVLDPRTAGALPDISDVAGAIITGSHGMVTDQAPWSESLAAWLRSAVSHNVPVLGICYGHQLLAHALGGEVSYHPEGIELGTVSVRLTDAARLDSLFQGLPDEFGAQVVHRQSVRKLPPGAVLLGGNAFEPHQAFRVGDAAWGVQFHPEFSSVAMSGYIDELGRRSDLEPMASKSLLKNVLATDDAASLLPKFAELASRHSAFKSGSSENR